MPELNYFVHDSSFVDDGVQIGEGTQIWHFSHVMDGARIGEQCTFGQNVFIGRNVVIGSHVKIQNNVSVYEGVELEDSVFCGPSMVFTNVSTPRASYPRDPDSGYLPTLVKRGASIGANVTIVCGVTIGEWALIGAGAVVTRDIPAQALAVGVPADVVGWVCECGHTLNFEGDHANCCDCGLSYSKRSESIVERV